MDDLDQLLNEFEQTLEKLRKDGDLTRQAPNVFKQFAAEVERRTGRDRRKTSRDSQDRRQK